LSQLGYEAHDWLRLQRDLLAIGSADAASRQVATRHGHRFEVAANLEGPRGLSATVRTIWFVRHGDAAARFITVYLDDRA
jgi:hypothetical protein